MRILCSALSLLLTATVLGQTPEEDEVYDKDLSEYEHNYYSGTCNLSKDT